jgi:8-oxo-dGTP pyrophosphatase MutT (NUDIX family)
LSREVQEEVGLSPGAVLWETQPWDSAVSLHGSLVFPFVGFLQQDEVPSCSVEVDDWAWCSWESLLNKSLWEFQEFERANGSKLLMPAWKGWAYPTWGLTAFFLRSFLYRTTQDPFWLQLKP